MKKESRMELTGYMTVEASVIIPFAFILLLVSVFFSFYLYDQCVTIQSCYLAALRGSQIVTLSDTDIETEVKAKLDEKLANQIFISDYQYSANVTPLHIDVTGTSEVPILSGTMKLYNKESLKIEQSSHITRLNPVWYIRGHLLFE